MTKLTTNYKNYNNKWSFLNLLAITHKENKIFLNFTFKKKSDRLLFLLSILISALSKPDSVVVAAADAVASAEFRSVKRIN